MEHGLIATCGITELEVLFSARGGATACGSRPIGGTRTSGCRSRTMTCGGPCSVQAELADRGQLRALSLPDLIIAAVAERHRVCVLHYHGEYEHVARITGQATRWVVPRGSVA